MEVGGYHYIHFVDYEIETGSFGDLSKQMKITPISRLLKTFHSVGNAVARFRGTHFLSLSTIDTEVW